jgi:hypothetical protein
VPAAVVAWLASAPDVRELNGQSFAAQKEALVRGLHEDWRK